MTSNPVDKIIELTSDSEEDDDEPEIDDICVSDTSYASFSNQRYNFVERSPISLEKGLFRVSGLLRIFFSVACCPSPMPEHRGPWTCRATSVRN